MCLREWKRRDPGREVAEHETIGKYEGLLLAMKADRSVTRDQIRGIEADLRGQGVTMFPPTTSGIRAEQLWQKARATLLRGQAIEMTLCGLGLGWHRQELKRARDILVEMGLIR
jgi:hypothetical protein